MLLAEGPEDAEEPFFGHRTGQLRTWLRTTSRFALLRRQASVLSAARNLASVAIPPGFSAAISSDNLFRPESLLP